MPRPAPGFSTQARRPRPSEKNASRVISSTSPQGHPSSDCPPLEGRAPHARNIGITATPDCLLLATGSSATHRGSCYTRACARPYNADAQSASLRENRLSRHLQHFSARPSVPGLPPAEGRAPHARWERSGSTRGMSSLGHRAFLCPR